MCCSSSSSTLIALPLHLDLSIGFLRFEFL
jgi:hypothetical protein